MRVFCRLSPRVASLLAILTVLSVISAQAQQREKTSEKTSKIKNFDCINDAYYRGAQPKAEDYADLASIGVKTVIDLQKDGKGEERDQVEAAGMKFFRIPMSDSEKPTAEQAVEFLKIVN